MKAATFIGDEKQAVFTLQFKYHDFWRKVENATVKRSEDSDWFIVGYERAKAREGIGGKLFWAKTGAIKSYKFEDCDNVSMLDIYEYEGE